MSTVLAIETSCDETAVAIARCDKDHAKILSNEVSSQIKLHAQYGGVVPNLAAREHVKNILPLLKIALKEARCTRERIDLIAVTNGPGLIPALLVGTSSARTLSWLWEKPLLGVHHIEGHIYANAITHSQVQSSNFKFQKQGTRNNKKNIHALASKTRHSPLAGGEDTITFPILALVVSGGHTQLILMREHFQYEIVGETQDDAVGEAFDKVARILNLGYPGGHQIDTYAKKYKESKVKSQKSKVSLPRPMLNSPNFHFSFSGLKTAVLYATQKMSPKELQKRTPEICAEFQQAAIDVLIAKTIKAAKKYDVKTVILAGGVSANTQLRNQLGISLSEFLPHTKYKIPDTKYSLDNAAMIASAAGIHYARMNQKKRTNLQNSWRTLETRADLQLQ